MPLHPQAIEFFQYAAATGQPELHELSLEQARAVVDGASALIGPGPAVASVEDVMIAVRDGEIPARVYRPNRSRATIVWFHGGGWVVGGIDSHDAMARGLANAAGATVVNVAYRLAPEDPYPVPLEDAWDSLKWAAARFPDVPLIVGGDSAGGNLAAVTALRARAGGPELALQILVYPITDAAMDTGSYREHGDDHLMLSAADMAWFFDHYVPDPAGRLDPEVSPLRAPDLSGAAPAIVVTDEYDPLRDEGLAYAERLREAGVPVTAHHYEDMMHVFFQFVNVFERGNEAVAQVGGDVRAALDGTALSRAVRYEQYGGVDVLRVIEVETPPAGPGQLRVRVKVAGLNLGESKIRQGLLHELWPATFPSGQGTDLAGVVEQVGPGVEGFAVGDEVISFTHERASQAELVLVEASNAVHRPPNVPWEVAGSLFVAGTTAWAAVRAITPAPGETVVVAGAAGGVGSIAVQLLRRAGARVIGVASQPHHAWLSAHGAMPVWYGPGLENRIAEAAGSPIDAFIDTAGHGYVRLALDLGVDPSRIDTIADFQAAAEFGVQTAGNADGGTADVLAELAGLIDRGELEVPIDRVYAIDEVREAYLQLEERHASGKIALAIA